MLSRSERFVTNCDNKCKCSVEISEQELADRMLKYSHMPPEQNEVVSSAQLFFEKALTNQKILLHAVAVAVDGEAFLFFAPPSGGKSTMANNWKHLLGGRAVIIADDSPIIGYELQESYVWNSCWSKETEEINPKRYMLKGIAFIYKSRMNRNIPMQVEQAVQEIVKGYPKDVPNRKLIEEILLSSLMGLRCWKCFCDGSYESASAIMDIMIG